MPKDGTLAQDEYTHDVVLESASWPYRAQTPKRPVPAGQPDAPIDRSASRPPSDQSHCGITNVAVSMSRGLSSSGSV